MKKPILTNTLNYLGVPFGQRAVKNPSLLSLCLFPMGISSLGLLHVHSYFLFLP